MNEPLIGLVPATMISVGAAVLASKNGRRWWVWYLAASGAIWALNVGADVYAMKRERES